MKTLDMLDGIKNLLTNSTRFHWKHEFIEQAFYEFLTGDDMMKLSDTDKAFVRGAISLARSVIKSRTENAYLCEDGKFRGDLLSENNVQYNDNFPGIRRRKFPYGYGMISVWKDDPKYLYYLPDEYKVDLADSIVDCESYAKVSIAK